MAEAKNLGHQEYPNTDPEGSPVNETFFVQQGAETKMAAYYLHIYDSGCHIYVLLVANAWRTGVKEVRDPNNSLFGVVGGGVIGIK